MERKGKSYVAYVDASYKNGHASHCFIVKRKGKILHQRKYSSYERTSAQAELNTAIKLLQFCLEKSIRNVTVRTDFKYLADSVNEGLVSKRGNINTDYLKVLLKQTNSKIEWISRNKNKVCDGLSRNPNKRKIKKGLLIDWSDKYDRNRNFVRVT